MTTEPKEQPIIRALTGLRLVLILLTAVYLANIGSGVIEFVPDNLPAVGNADEILATLLLSWLLRHEPVGHENG